RACARSAMKRESVEPWRPPETSLLRHNGVPAMQDKRSWLMRATLSLVLAPTVAGASGFALLEQSGSRLGTAFAGTAVAADDATTVFFNPAGMTSLRQSEAVLSASGIDISSEFRNGNSLPAFAQPLGDNGGDAGSWNLVPAAYFAMPVGDSLAF